MHMMTLVHFDEAIIHLLLFSLVIFRCNITFSVFWLSQGSVPTWIRWGGWSSYCYMCRSFMNLYVKTALKCVDKVTYKNKLAPFYGPRCTFTLLLLYTQKRRTFRDECTGDGAYIALYGWPDGPDFFGVDHSKTGRPTNSWPTYLIFVFLARKNISL